MSRVIMSSVIMSSRVIMSSVIMSSRVIMSSVIMSRVIMTIRALNENGSNEFLALLMLCVKNTNTKA